MPVTVCLMAAAPSVLIGVPALWFVAFAAIGAFVGEKFMSFME